MTKGIILAAVDLVHKDADSLVVKEAISLARTHDCSVELVFVVPDQQNSYVQEYIPADMREKVVDEALQDLETYGQSFDWKGVVHSTQVLRGVVYEKLVEHVDELKASFVVIGASRPTVTDLFIGPNAARVSRYAACSVLVVRPQ